MPYALTIRADANNHQSSRHMMCYAVFSELDHDNACAYFTTVESANVYINLGLVPNAFVVPFKVTLKQWNALFAAGRIAWANHLKGDSLL